MSAGLIIFLVILFILLASAGVSLAAAYVVFKKVLGRLKPEESKPYKSSERRRISAFDGATLSGALESSGARTHTLVIACHGHRSNPEKDFSAILPMYRAMGFDVFLPDMRGHGESGGKYIGFGALDSRDIKSWCERFAPEYDSIILHGVSMGAASVLIASSLELPKKVRGVVADCGFSSANAEFRYLMKRRYKKPSFPLIMLADFWCGILAKYHFRDSAPLEAVKNSRIPLLLIHGGSDRYVPTRMAKPIFDAYASGIQSYKRDKALVLVPGADHAESASVNPRLYAVSLGAFAARVTSPEYFSR